MAKLKITFGPKDLANPECQACLGTGQVWLSPSRGRAAEARPLVARSCRCVSRAMFRICWERQRFYPGARRTAVDGEYAADLALSARRELAELEWQIFRLHFLEGFNCPVCCRLLGVDRGTFFGRVYRIEELLGQAWATLRPYALYPPYEYFVQRRGVAA